MPVTCTPHPPKHFDMTTAKVMPHTNATIIARFNTGERWIVLCRWDDNGPGCPFVTWAADDKGNAYWGHYFDDIARAGRDYDERIERGY